METTIDIPAEHMANVFGQFDAYLKKVLDVTPELRDRLRELYLEKK